MTPTLRSYQERGLDRARAAIAAGHRAPLIVCPTGGGKTLLGAEAARSHCALGGRVLWLAHRRELLEQAQNTLGAVGARAWTMSVQGLLSTWHLPEHRPTASLVILDEAHHHVAAEWRKVAEHYQDAFILGLTATPERGDGRGLGDVFDSLVIATTVRELTELGHLAALDVISPASRLGPGELAQHPVDAYLEHAPGELAVVFASTIAKAKEWAEEFEQRGGVSARAIHGDMPELLRTEYLVRHQAGEIRVLVNVFVLTEGWDSPATSTCILARGCTTPGAFLQMTGRVLRPHPNKPRALLIDLVGATHDHGRPDDDRSYSLSGRGIRSTESGPRFCMVCGALLEEDHVGACPDCGREVERREPKIVDSPLLKFTAIRRDDEDARAVRLRKWLEAARAKQFKEGWAAWKYKSVYGDWPTWTVKQKAKGAA